MSSVITSLPDYISHNSPYEIVSDSSNGLSRDDSVATQRLSSLSGASASGATQHVAGRGKRLQYRKTQFCPWVKKGTCNMGVNCNYAHTNEELRYKPDLTRTKLCSQIERGRNCTNVNCRFAHDYSELRATSAFYKTKLCKFWMKGHCQSEKACRHAHGSPELRHPEDFARARSSHSSGGSSVLESVDESPRGTSRRSSLRCSVSDRCGRDRVKSPESSGVVDRRSTRGRLGKWTQIEPAADDRILAGDVGTSDLKGGDERTACGDFGRSQERCHSAATTSTTASHAVNVQQQGELEGEVAPSCEGGANNAIALVPEAVEECELLTQMSPAAMHLADCAIHQEYAPECRCASMGGFGYPDSPPSAGTLWTIFANHKFNPSNHPSGCTRAFRSDTEVPDAVADADYSLAACREGGWSWRSTAPCSSATSPRNTSCVRFNSSVAVDGMPGYQPLIDTEISQSRDTAYDLFDYDVRGRRSTIAAGVLLSSDAQLGTEGHLDQTLAPSSLMERRRKSCCGDCEARKQRRFSTPLSAKNVFDETPPSGSGLPCSDPSEDEDGTCPVPPSDDGNFYADRCVEGAALNDSLSGVWENQEDPSVVGGNEYLDAQLGSIADRLLHEAGEQKFAETFLMLIAEVFSTATTRIDHSGRESALQPVCADDSGLVCSPIP